MAERSTVGRRERRLPAPPHVVWRSLVEPHQAGARPWLRLLDDEVEPRVLRAEEPGVVVWSSLWPRRPDDVLDLRYRVDQLLWSDLRRSYGQ